MIILLWSTVVYSTVVGLVLLMMLLVLLLYHGTYLRPTAVDFTPTFLFLLLLCWCDTRTAVKDEAYLLWSTNTRKKIYNNTVHTRLGRYFLGWLTYSLALLSNDDTKRYFARSAHIGCVTDLYVHYSTVLWLWRDLTWLFGLPTISWPLWDWNKISCIIPLWIIYCVVSFISLNIRTLTYYILSN